MTDTKLYVPVATLSAQDNIKLLQQLESGFKRTINWNKYLSKEKQMKCKTDFLIDASFQGVNRLCVLSFKDVDGRERYKQYYLPSVKIKGYNFMTDGRTFFDQPIKNEYTTGCLLDYLF